MFGIVLALVASAAYGAGDFFCGLAARSVASSRVIAVSVPVSAGLVLLAALVVGGTVDATSMLAGAAVGLTLLAGLWAADRTIGAKALAPGCRTS